MKELQLSSILIGIRFIRKFGIFDRWGEILDKIVDNKEFFHSDYFNQIGLSTVSRTDFIRYGIS